MAVVLCQRPPLLVYRSTYVFASDFNQPGAPRAFRCYAPPLREFYGKNATLRSFGMSTIWSKPEWL